MKSLAEEFRVNLRVLQIRLRCLAGAVFVPVPRHAVFDADGLTVRVFEQRHKGDCVLARSKAEL